MLRIHRAVSLLPVALLGATAACSDSPSGAGDRAALDMSVTVDRAQVGAPQSETLPNPVPSPPAGGLVIASGGDTIVVTRAQFVLREIELELADGEPCPAGARPGDDDDVDDCEEIERGPVLFDLPLTGATASRLSVDVPAGRYDELEVEIHKVDGNDDEDRAFLQQRPDFRGVSARLEGRYNGRPFTFITDVNGKVELEFRPPLQVGDDGTNITLAVDLARWFARGGRTGGLYDPALANTPGQVRAFVNNNIRASFRAMRDRNRDGRED